MKIQPGVFISMRMTTHSNSYNVIITSIHVCVGKPFLAVPPDGLVEDSFEPPDRHYSLLGIKYPHSARVLKPSAVCTELYGFCCGLVNGTPALKKNHDYHYQIH